MVRRSKNLAGRRDALRAHGVRFPIRANTPKKRQIEWRALCGAREDDIDAGAAGLARLQGMGFVHIRL